LFVFRIFSRKFGNGVNDNVVLFLEWLIIVLVCRLILRLLLVLMVFMIFGSLMIGRLWLRELCRKYGVELLYSIVVIFVFFKDIDVWLWLWL